MQTHDDTREAIPSVARRRFLAWVGWGSFAAFWVMATLATVRFLFPRVLFEPSPIFQAGKPEDYQVGEISTRFLCTRQKILSRLLSKACKQSEISS